jgi:hypothetical protein
MGEQRIGPTVAHARFDVPGTGKSALSDIQHWYPQDAEMVAWSQEYQAAMSEINRLTKEN